MIIICIHTFDIDINLKKTNHDSAGMESDGGGALADAT
jgi:hypothetical protein